MTDADQFVPVDPLRYRQVLGQYPTGVCVITAKRGGAESVAMVVGSFASVSLNPPLIAFFPDRASSSWAKLRDCEDFYDGRRLLTNLLDIEVPVIAAVNGPVRIHPEIPVLSDVVLAADTALFQDAPHFMSGIVPGDGAHIVWPHVLGPNRGRYFLITGQELGARTALEYGVVNEVLPADKLLGRAKELARYIAGMPTLTRRYTRLALTQRLKRLMQEGLGYGLAFEALAAIDQLPVSGRMKDVR